MPPPKRGSVDQGFLDSADRARLTTYGCAVAQTTGPFTMGRKIQRPGLHADCLFHALLGTNNPRSAAGLRSTLADNILKNADNPVSANPPRQSAAPTFQEVIQTGVGGLGTHVSAQGYHAHMRRRHHPDFSPDAPRFGGVPEIIAFSRTNKRCVQMFATTDGVHFQP